MQPPLSVEIDHKVMLLLARLLPQARRPKRKRGPSVPITDVDSESGSVPDSAAHGRRGIAGRSAVGGRNNHLRKE